MDKIFVRKAISKELSSEIDEMIEKIKKIFGINLSIIQASRVVAWKSKNYHSLVNEKKLIEILGVTLNAKN